MKQITKLKICDWTLLPLSVIILSSGIQLEILSGQQSLWIWIHILISSLFLILCSWHIWLHFKKSNWFGRFRKSKSQVTRILWWISIFTFLTGIITTIHWVTNGEHSPIGAIHGKIGFLMTIFVAAHAIIHYKFYLRK